MTAKIYQFKLGNVVCLKSKNKAADAIKHKPPAKEYRQKASSDTQPHKPLNSDNGIFY